MATRRRNTRRAKLDALPDTLDFRDRMFEASLVSVPKQMPLGEYRNCGVPVLDQGTEGACTGFALATVVHFLLRTTHDDGREISPWMLYRMARRYDEWPGENYDGSSARGAMKAWHKHGVCKKPLWSKTRSRINADIAKDSSARPLGSYLRVNHRDLVAMHAAITEVGVLYATGNVHAGWEDIGADGIIEYSPEIRGGHAFAIVAYDAHGFWIQNSWADDWGYHGFGRIGYDDWLENGSDVWVARLGVPIELHETVVGATANGSAHIARTGEPSFDRLRPHIVSLGNDGELRDSGTYATDRNSLREIVDADMPRITQNWKKPKILLYAHGGLVGEKAAIQRVSDYLDPFLAAEIYPIAFVWKTDYWTTLTNMLRDVVRRRRTEGILDAAKDFMLDRLDDALEPLARVLTGKAEWSEMKENGLRATTRAQGGGRTLAKLLHGALAGMPASTEIHIAGHSAGSILMAPLVQYLATKGEIKKGPMRGKTGLGRKVASCSLWAPACTVDLFNESYAPLIQSKRIERFALYTLTDKVERDDHCAHIYNKSLLYLVSDAFEDRARIPLIHGDGEPILGMSKFVEKEGLTDLFKQPDVDWIQSPNGRAVGDPLASKSTAHGDFDDDEATIKGTMARISTAKTAASARVSFTRSPEGRRNRREALVQSA